MANYSREDANVDKSNLEAERAAPASENACSSCGLTMEESRHLAARRAPAVGEDGLPPLPAPVGQIRTDVERANAVWFGPLPPHGTNLHTAEQVRQAQRDAVAADRAARHNHKDIT